MPIQPPIMLRPIRMAAVLFVGMNGLFIACAPLAPEVDFVLFLGAGTAYCLLLALFSVGLALAYPSRAISWWIVAGSLPVLSFSIFWLLFRSDPETYLHALLVASHGLLAVFGTWLAVGIVIAGSGWIRYIRSCC